MKKNILMICALLTSATIFGSQSNKEVDGELFLNSFIETELQQVANQIVLDAGAGFDSRVIAAAKNGAKVCAVGTQKKMLDQAKTVAEKMGVESQISFTQVDMESLPYGEQQFDRAFCIHVGTTLPSTMHLVSQDQYQVIGMGAHFRELSRVLKEGGRLLVAAPASYDVVFTDGTLSETEASKKIKDALAQIEGSEDSAEITKHLSGLDGILRATFAFRQGELRLVTDQKDLKMGETIWCKVPTGVTSDYYHSEEEYLVAINKAGLTCEEIKRPCFFGGVKYRMWKESQSEENQSLGEAYINNNPFTLYYVVKNT